MEVVAGSGYSILIADLVLNMEQPMKMVRTAKVSGHISLLYNRVGITKIP